MPCDDVIPGADLGVAGAVCPSPRMPGILETITRNRRTITYGYLAFLRV